MTDEHLIEKLKTGRPGSVSFQRAARFMYKKWKGYLYQFSKKHPLLSQEDMEDTYHEALQAVIQAIIRGTYHKEQASISSFLYAVFSNKCLDKIRSRTNHKSKWEAQLESVTPELPVASRNFLHALLVEEEMQQVVSLMDQLGKPCKELILAMEYWGYSPEDTAQAYGYKDGKSASQAKYRCLKQLRSLIANRKLR